VSPTDIARFTQIDYDRDLALAALAPTPEGEEFIGVVRYVREADLRRAEFAIVIRDDWQGKGLGSLLMQRLEEAAHSAGIGEIAGRVLSANRSMLALMRSRGYRLDTVPGESPALVMATYPLPRKECA
jgi:acetyltransferase